MIPLSNRLLLVSVVGIIMIVIIVLAATAIVNFIGPG